MESAKPRQVLFFAALSLAVAWFFFAPLNELLRMAIKDELYSYIPLIPVVSAALVFRSRKTIFSDVGLDPVLGLGIVVLGGLLFMAMLGTGTNVSRDDFLSGAMASAVLCFYGCFVGSFGRRAFKAALFPLLFLLFMVPIPTPILNRIVHFLQVGSTEMAHGLFWLTGVPFLREGFTFHLPDLNVEVAEQCSGIRSSVSLVIVSVLMSRFVLKTLRMRVLLVLSTVPITILKNGVRIVTLSLLGAYVDQRVLDSQLHRSGGIPIFGLALVLLFATAWVLRKLESKAQKEIHRGGIEA